MRAHSLVAVLHLAGFVAGALIAPAADARYRWVGPDGTVNYTDTPPPPGARAVAPVPAAAASQPATGPVLPHALRSVASKFPVTLYATGDCQPCEQARSHLLARGIPFAERSVRSAADLESFRRLGFGAEGFPALSVGRERSTGFEPGAWNRLLDAAGYPQTSALPRGYRQPAAQALAQPAVAATVTGGGPAASGSDGTDEAGQPDAAIDAEATAPAAATSNRSRREPAAAVPSLRF